MKETVKNLLSRLLQFVICNLSVLLIGLIATLIVGMFAFTDVNQSAGATALAAFYMEQVSCHDINPVYMKDSQAERMKKEREAK